MRTLQVIFEYHYGSINITKKGLEMLKQLIKDSKTLLAAIDIMHDSGFKIDDIDYNSAKKEITVNTIEYEYKGKRIQTKTDKVNNRYRLVLSHLEDYELVLKDKKGYHAVCEDYVIRAEIDKDNIIIVCIFHDLKLKYQDINGELSSLN